MIFPVIETDKIVQVNDKFRISLKKTYKPPGTGDFVACRIKPEASGVFYDVHSISAPTDTSVWFLDWQYATAGTKVITAEVDYMVGLVLTTETVTASVTCLTEADDKLFSTDQDLVSHQHDILNYVPEGRSSWKYVARRAQELILAYFDEQGLRNADQTKITKAQVVDVSEVKELSVYKTLRLCFETLSNAPDDFFIKRAEYWQRFESAAQKRCVTKLDFDKSGTLEDSEVVSLVNITARRV